MRSPLQTLVGAQRGAQSSGCQFPAVVVWGWSKTDDFCPVSFGFLLLLVVEMSRRKQAKPRSLRREDLQSVAFDDESSQDTLTFSDTKISIPGSPTEHFETSSVVSEDHNSLFEDDDELEDALEDEDLPNACASCKQRFETLTDYIQHLNQDGCMAGNPNDYNPQELYPPNSPKKQTE
ncbi:hypothetical protein JTE90_007404 [Oedothorax gibbosus]|uniref:C2H2-type domain-containing protein n=1 Tax=Oedothorax gibbosus TaxID=931172 RepID=A0AAV6UK34_9ARAC|nr:hypothetical protein JTE90_007404 [Oedothorax gibbosus]